MANTTANYEEHINKMYDSNLQSQKTQLETAYQQGIADLDKEKATAQKQADDALTRTYVEAAKAQKAQQEYDNVYGLTSGAMAQARLAQDNQLQADLTTIRAAQQEADAEVERQRSLLAKEYTAAITQAQADNDMERAQALYEAAKQADAELLTKQKEAASLMAGAGDFSLYQALYGLTDEQVRLLKGTSTPTAHFSDPSDEYVYRMYDNGGVAESAIKRMQTQLGVTADGKWSAEDQSAAKKSYGISDPAELYKMFVNASFSNKTSYDGIQRRYAQLKQGGATQTELDDALRYYVSTGAITDRQAAEIRDSRY